MSYSVGQLQQVLRQAGWPESLIVTMAAIGLSESSGRPDAVNNSPPREYSVGLWQINLLAHPEYSEAQMKDPVQNAAAALRVYQQQGLRAWGPYITGIYRANLPASQAAYGVPSETVAGASGGSDNGEGYGEYDPGSYSTVLASATPQSEAASLAPLLLIGGGVLLLYLVVK